MTTITSVNITNFTYTFFSYIRVMYIPWNRLKYCQNFTLTSFNTRNGARAYVLPRMIVKNAQPNITARSSHFSRENISKTFQKVIIILFISTSREAKQLSKVLFIRRESYIK